jgi:glycosyltransferase involved in cell wall biosynthesis
LIPITQKDSNYYSFIGNIKPHIVVPTGFDFSNLSFNHTCEHPPSIFHIGALDWKPNQDGLYWFVKNVWNVLNKKNSDLKFIVAGRNAPQNFIDFLIENHVDFVGEIDNSKLFISSHSIMIVPLLSGSGMRIKIIEGMSLGKVIITTSVGIEGIDAINKKHVIISDEPEEIIFNINSLLSNEVEFQEIEKNAFTFAKENYDNNVISKKLLNFYQSNCK